MIQRGKIKLGTQIRWTDKIDKHPHFQAPPGEGRVVWIDRYNGTGHPYTVWVSPDSVNLRVEIRKEWGRNMRAAFLLCAKRWDLRELIAKQESIQLNEVQLEDLEDILEIVE